MLCRATCCRSAAYWNRVSKIDATFLWQHISIPFAFPNVGTPNELGKTLITYPTKITDQLRLPWTQKMCDIIGIEYKEQTKKEKKERALMKKQIEAQLMLGVLNY